MLRLHGQLLQPRRGAARSARRGDAGVRGRGHGAAPAQVPRLRPDSDARLT